MANSKQRPSEEKKIADLERRVLELERRPFPVWVGDDCCLYWDCPDGIIATLAPSSLSEQVSRMDPAAAAALREALDG